MSKIGQSYFRISADDDGKTDWGEYVVRTIRGGRVHAIWKTSFTWVKKSSKHFDWGWADYIPDWCRESWRVGDKPQYVHSTKLQAINAAIKDHKNYMCAEDYDDPQTYTKILKKFKSMKARARPKK